MILYMYIAPGQGQTTPWGWNFDVNRNILSLPSFATSFKKISLKFDFLQFFFHDFIHVYSPRAGADNPLGMKFWCQQEHLVPSDICYKFQKNHFEAWFYTIFFMILYMYIAPGQGQKAPRGQNFDVNRKALPIYPFVVSFKEISLKSDFIHFFAPGQERTGDKVLMSTETSCHFGHPFQIIDDNSFWKIHCFTFFPYKSIRDQIWPCRKIGQGQPTVIIWANFVVLRYPMMRTKNQGHWPFGSREEDFFSRFLPYMAMAAILVMWPGPFEQTFVPSSRRSSIWNLTLIGPVVSEEKMFKECGRRQTTDDGRRRTTDDGRRRPTYPISSSYEPSAQVS